MINLLPDDQKRDIQAARMNVVLLRYNILAAVAIGLLTAAFFLFIFILHNTQANAVSANDDNSKKAASFASVRHDADEYRNNLSIANAILNKSVNYTSVIFAITKLVPNGVVLDAINLGASDFGQQTSFSAHAKSYAQATQLKENFQSAKVFSNVYFQSLTDNSASGDELSKSYPIAVTISAKLSKDVTQ